MQQQNWDLAGELAEKEKELEEATAEEELANLVRMRKEAINTLHNKLTEAKRIIAEQKAELDRFSTRSWWKMDAAWQMHFDWLTAPEV